MAIATFLSLIAQSYMLMFRRCRRDDAIALHFLIKGLGGSGDFAIKRHADGAECCAFDYITSASAARMPAAPSPRLPYQR